MAAAGTVHPPNLAAAVRPCEFVKHCEWGHANPGAEQHERTAAIAKDESAARGSNVEDIALMDVLV